MTQWRLVKTAKSMIMNDGVLLDGVRDVHVTSHFVINIWDCNPSGSW